MNPRIWIAPGAMAALLGFTSISLAGGLLGGLLDISSDGISVNVPNVVEVNVGGSGSGLGVNASVLPSVGGGVDANVNIGASPGGVGVGADVSVLGNTPSGGVTAGADVCISNCGINASADVSVFGNHKGGIQAGADVGIGHGKGIAADVNASVLDGYRGGINADVGLRVGGGQGINAAVGVSILGGQRHHPATLPPGSGNRPVWASIQPQMAPPPVALGSSKLRMVDRIIRNRAWTTFQSGSAICLPRLRIAVMDSWLPSRDMAALQQLIHHHRSEIATLQVMLGACESNRLSRSDLSRIVSVDIQADGIPVLFML